MFKKEKTKIFSSQSFTLLEVLIAIFIFTIGIVAILLLVEQPRQYLKTISNKTIAVYLAQEGLEIVRNIRDTNLLNKCYKNFNINWNDWLGEGDWEVDYKMGRLYKWQERFFYIDENGFYFYPLGDFEDYQQTNFKRKISIKNINIEVPQQPQAPIPIKGIKVTVTVYYNEKEIYSLQEYLFNLYEAVKDKAGGCPAEQSPTSSEEFLL